MLRREFKGPYQCFLHLLAPLLQITHITDDCFPKACCRIFFLCFLSLQAAVGFHSLHHVIKINQLVRFLGIHHCENPVCFYCCQSCVVIQSGLQLRIISITGHTRLLQIYQYLSICQPINNKK